MLPPEYGVWVQLCVEFYPSVRELVTTVSVQFLFGSPLLSLILSLPPSPIYLPPPPPPPPPHSLPPSLPPSLARSHTSAILNTSLATSPTNGISFLSSNYQRMSVWHGVHPVIHKSFLPCRESCAIKKQFVKYMYMYIH